MDSVIVALLLWFGNPDISDGCMERFIWEAGLPATTIFETLKREGITDYDSASHRFAVD